MIPFSLEKYLANPARQVVTRDGRPARIICTNAKCKYHVIALVETDDMEITYNYNAEGKGGTQIRIKTITITYAK